MISILQGGFQSTVQDLGRPGWRREGISPGGACDSLAARVCNLLVGNPEDAAVIEVALGGLRLEVEEERLIAWGGGDFAVRLQGEDLRPGRPALLAAGEQLSFGYARAGCRAWLAVSGGVASPVLLGSRATDLRGGFGGWEGRGLRSFDRLPLGECSPLAQKLGCGLESTRISAWGAPADWVDTVRRQPVLRIVRGAEWDRFAPEAHAAFLGEPFIVTPDANRMGVRLRGPELPQAGGEILSAGVAPGTIQVPPGGQPIILLADGQTIGGYSKLAHVVTVDLPFAAQLRPGDTALFQEVSLAEAHRLLQERERDVGRFRLGLALRGP